MCCKSLSTSSWEKHHGRACTENQHPEAWECLFSKGTPIPREGHQSHRRDTNPPAPHNLKHQPHPLWEQATHGLLIHHTNPCSGVSQRGEKGKRSES